jgi:cysteine synthase B
MPLGSTSTARSCETAIGALVGRTPLVRLRVFEPRPGVEILAKLESRNPGGSVKDRAALAMILAGERTRALRPGRILLDATSGNTGIAYAMLAASRGHRVRLCVPASITPERKRLMQAYGAELVLTDPMEGSDGAIREARRLYEQDPEAFFYPDQYNNPENWRAHYHTTAPEILEQTNERITHFVAGLGTSGTFMGVGRRLREWRSSVRLLSVQPASPLHGLEGLKHMGSAIVPGIYDPALADRALHVSTEEGFEYARRLAREAGILAGPSGGAALAACVRVARDLESAVIVTVLPDGGERYLSERYWDEQTDPASAGYPPDSPAVPLTAAVLDSIRSHGAASYPDECCGALIGTRDRRVHTALLIGNTSATERQRRFLVGPDDYRRAEAAAAAAGAELLGFYHSHPDHPARPSKFDLEHAWPNFSYVIVSVLQGRSGDVRSWRLRPDRSEFTEERIVTLDCQRKTSCPSLS